MKIIWLSDVHLNFVKKENRLIFFAKLAAQEADCIVVTGDISEAHCHDNFMTEMSYATKKDVLYVRGNHDFYRSSVQNVRGKFDLIKSVEYKKKDGYIICDEEELLCITSIILCMTEIKCISFEKSPGFYIVGQDCWADGRNGDYANTSVRMNDSVYIEELASAISLDWVINLSNGFIQPEPYPLLLTKMQQLADRDAKDLEEKLALVCSKEDCKKVLVLVHIPPFKENAMYRGEISSNDHLPFYTSKVTGDMLLKVAGDNPSIEFTVLCGHSHSKSFYQPLPNLTVKSGNSEYGKPEIIEVLEI